MDWAGCYDAQAGRDVRSVLLQALTLRGNTAPGIAPRPA